jgi:hypothetical protein
MNPDISRMLPLFGCFRVVKPVLQGFATDELAPTDRYVGERSGAGHPAIQKTGQMCLRTAEELRHFGER